MAQFLGFMVKLTPLSYHKMSKAQAAFLAGISNKYYFISNT
jgi:hypothetical protein